MSGVSYQDISRKHSTKRPHDAPTSVATEWLKLFAQALALVSVLAYAIIRYSYQRFYEEFGLSPEDVGATSTTILAQSAFGISVLVILLAIPSLIAVWAVLLVAARMQPSRSRRLVLFALLFCALGWAWWIALQAGLSATNALLLAALQATIFAIGKTGTQMAPVAARRIWRGTAVAVVIVVGVALVSDLPRAAANAGRCSSEGGFTIRSFRSLENLPFVGRISLLGVRAERVGVTWLGATSAPPSLAEAIRSGHALLHLGASGGVVFLYDADAGKSMQVPSTSLFLESAVKTSRTVPIAPKVIGGVRITRLKVIERVKEPCS